MNNQVFGKIFLTILVAGLLFFGVANAGAAAVDKWLFPTTKFDEHTYIGGTEVSNMEIASAMMQLSGTTENWQQSSELLVTYQDATASYPLDNAEILLEETTEQAQSGVQNNFIYDLQDKATERFFAENFTGVEFSESEVQKLTMKLEQALQAGLEKTHVVISDDSLVVNRENVSETISSELSTSEEVVAIVEAINGLQISPGETFSFLEVIDEIKPIGVTDAQLTEIASTIYSVVLKTNFKIEKRTIGTQIPKNIAVGQEATINRALGIDLVFSNPNASSFILNTAISGSSLTASLYGFPFVYEYAVITGGNETVNPRLIKQYSAFVTSGKKVEEEGSKGIRVEVTRSIMDDEEELKVESISTDFYPPIDRVELYPLTAPPAEESLKELEDGETPTDSTSGSNGVSAESGSEQKSEDGKQSTDSKNDKTETKEGEPNSSPDKETGNSTSSSDKGSGSGKPVYDKGGNLVNP